VRMFGHKQNPRYSDLPSAGQPSAIYIFVPFSLGSFEAGSTDLALGSSIVGVRSPEDMLSPRAMPPVPSVVKEAIASYSPDTGFVLRPLSTREKSVIYSWGVRVGNETDPDQAFKWVCLAVQECREQRVSFALSGGKTSKAVKHLRDAHGMESAKALPHDEEIKRLQQSRGL
jgi:hypothetical protein